MSELILDRLGRIRDLPPFVATTGPRDRQIGRVTAFIALGGGAALAAALLAGLSLLLVAAFLHSIRGGVSFPDAISTVTDLARPRSLGDRWVELSIAGVSSLAGAVAGLSIAARFFGRPVRSFLTAAPRFRWGGIAAGFVIAAPLVALAFAAERFTGTGATEAPILSAGAGALERAGYAAAAVVFLYLAAFAEEAIFRGWLLQQTAAWTRSLPLILGVNGIIFSLAHFDPDVGGFLVRAVMGAGWAWIALRTAGVEFTTGAHLANNLFVALFVAPVSFSAPTRGPADIRPALLELLLIAILIWAVEMYLRLRKTS